MAVIFANMLKCPECNFPLDMHILSISSRLGPEVAVCRKCKIEFGTTRQEWPFESKKKLAFFFLSSFALISIGALISANCFYAGIEKWNGNPKPASLPFENLFFQKLLYISFAALTVFQSIRIYFSAKRRSENKNTTTSTSYSPNFIFATQLKVLILILALSSFGYLK